MSKGEFIFHVVGPLLGFIAGLLVYRKNGKRFEADALEARAKVRELKAELEILKAKLKG